MTTTPKQQAKRSSGRFNHLLMIPLCVVAAFGLSHVSTAQETPAETASQQTAATVPVAITTQGGTTRVIFDLPALTPYVAHKKADGAEFVFRTPAKFGTAKGSSPALANLSIVNGNGSVTASLSLQPGSSYKHYRLQKKVVIEIASTQKAAPAKTEEKKPAAPKAAAASEKTAPTKAEPQKPVPPAVVTSVAPAAPEPAPEAIKSEGPEIAAAPVPPVTAASADNTPTHLRLETLEAVKIAVFTRLNNLWFVLDTTSSATQPPVVSGPLAAYLGNPRMVDIKDGVAYRYTLPRSSFVTARKENMGWDVTLTPAPVQAPSDIQANIEFDNKKAKIVLPLKGSGKVLEITDPDVGDRISVVAANTPASRVDQARRFTNLEILPAAIGVAVKPLSDDIKINRIEDFVLITSPMGIIATPPSLSGPALTLAEEENISADAPPQARRLFDFPNWRQGGPQRLFQNLSTLQNQIAQSESPEVRNELLMKMALLYFANNMGQETLGILRMLEENDPDLFTYPNVMALRGVAAAMANHYDDALKDLTNPALQQNPEAKLWIGTVAAATEQWQMANREFPKDNSLLVSYPENIAVPITIYMAESALRLGRTADAQKLLDTLKMMPSATDVHYGAAIAYLRGEIARQEGRSDDAVRIWKDVSIGIDRLYHTKASLALANLQLQKQEITPQQAVDQVDSLRFAWRGDGLEVQIMHSLGLIKVQAGKYLEGMQDLKAASLLADSLMQDSDPMKADIMRSFNAVFSGKADQKISPIEAVSVYNEFNSLAPAGDAGTEIKLRAADFMITIDLLGKAAGILEGLLNSGFVPPEKIAGTGGRLAAVYLLDDKPEAAIATLDKTASSPMDDAEKERRALLMARAQSQMNDTDKAINTLSDHFSTDAQKLKVDVLWRARRWGEAAEVLLSILPDPAEKNLNDEKAQLIVNAAVACKLAGNSACLQSMKTTYAAAMAGTKQSTTFTVITREGGASSLADRDTILRIAGEADLFRQFLESYKSNAADMTAPTGGAAPESAPAPSAAQ